MNFDVSPHSYNFFIADIINLDGETINEEYIY